MAPIIGVRPQFPYFHLDVLPNLAISNLESRISNFSMYSIGIILTRLKKDDVFHDFLSDTIEDSGVAVLRLGVRGLKQALELRREFHFDFDDAYQYAAAVERGCTLVSFDADFDATALGRKTPSQVLSGIGL